MSFLSMECCNTINRNPKIETLSAVEKSPKVCATLSSANVGFSSSTRRNGYQSQVFGIHEYGRHLYARRRSQPLAVAVVSAASAEPRGSKSSCVITPHEPSSPEGKLLSCILQSRRHLFQFAVEEQLDELASSKDSASMRKNQSSISVESLLQRRIEEVKEKERQIAVEDVMYMSIVHKFSVADIPMVPKLLKCINGNTVDIKASNCRELESIHSLEVLKMIKEHLARILCTSGKSQPINGVTTTKIDRLHLGGIYASSIMYGYLLNSARFKRQLDSNLGNGTFLSTPELFSLELESLVTLGQLSNTQVTSFSQESQRWNTTPEKLTSYIMGFHSKSLQKCGKLKSKEAVNVIEKHTWALFGDEKMGNEIEIIFPSLERLMMEAVAFGSFLWDVERTVNSVYELMEN